MPSPSVDQLERLIGEARGEPVRIRSFEPVPPWAVARCVLEASPPLIVKWLREDGHRVDLRQIATERAALEFLAGIGFAQAPRVHGADLAAGILVLEDLSPCTPLADLLRRQGGAASASELHSFARISGALNAATAGKAEAYDAIRGRYGAPDPLTGRAMGLGAGWPDTARVLDEFGLALPAAAERELAEAVETLMNPGPFLAFSNGDPEANNFLVREGGDRMIDFEMAAFRHALTCATWIHVPGPAWITVAAPAQRADLEAAYRAALREGVPEAGDDRLFGFGMAAACLALAYDRLNRLAKLDQRPAGDDSRLQMVATLEAAAAAARRHRSLPHLADGMARVAEGLRRRWADADVDLGGYPPFAARA